MITEGRGGFKMENVTIRKKLFVFCIVVVLTIVGLSVFFMNQFSAISGLYRQITETNIPQEAVANAMSGTLLRQQLNIKNLHSIERMDERFGTSSEKIMKVINTYRLLTEAMVQGSNSLGQEIKDLEGVVIPSCPKGGQIELLIKEGDDIFSDYKKTCESIITKKNEILQLIDEIGWHESDSSARGLVKELTTTEKKLNELIIKEEDSLKWTVEELSNYKNRLLKNINAEDLKKYKDVYDMIKAFNLSKEVLKILDEDYNRVLMAIVEKKQRLDRNKEELDGMVTQTFSSVSTKLEESILRLKMHVHGQMLQVKKDAGDKEHSAKRVLMMMEFLAILVSGAFGWFISKHINNALEKIIGVLDQGTDELVKASSQVASASQSLANGSSEQASALEETASSLEDMSATTVKNAESAIKANRTMKEDAATNFKTINDRLEQMDSEIKTAVAASEETAKVIKTIDGIAFQTNLLALNAAVEAARAGEAGAGFAVVAEEVRSLALRAAKSARETADLIENANKHITATNALKEQVKDAMVNYSAIAQKVSNHIEEVSIAAAEQKSGIEQINYAVANMNGITQKNAANAEEAASASVIMNGLVEQTKQVVNDLRKLVGGRDSDEGEFAIQDRHAYAMEETPIGDFKNQRKLIGV
jgi:methyl-accepting chemotaxis protein